MPSMREARGPSVDGPVHCLQVPAGLTRIGLMHPHAIA
jgi:hypothetical protein